MNNIKNLLNSIGSFFLAILLALCLPLIVIWAWVKAIFSDNIGNRKKVRMTKEAIVILGLCLLLFLIEYLRDSKIWDYLFYLAIPVLIVLVLKQKFYDKK